MSQSNSQAEKPKQEKPAVNKEKLAQSIADKQEAIVKNKIVKK